MNAVVGALEGIAGLGATTLGYSLVEAQAFTTRQVSAEVLPKGSNDLRVLHLSDLHITPAQTRKIKWVQSLIELQPDLVVCTGDFLAHQLAVPAQLRPSESYWIYRALLCWVATITSPRL